MRYHSALQITVSNETYHYVFGLIPRRETFDVPDVMIEDIDRERQLREEFRATARRLRSGRQ
jgi:hypothetical protein